MCGNCGEPIGQGYDVNPTNSKWCALCISDYEEENDAPFED